MIWIIAYLTIGALLAAVSVITVSVCDGDHATHVHPSGAERALAAIVLTFGWAVAIPLFALAKLVDWMQNR